MSFLINFHPVILHHNSDIKTFQFQRNISFKTFSSFFKKNYLFIFLAVLGLRCCVWAFSRCGERGLLFIAVHGLLIVVASLVDHGLQAHRLSSFGARAQLFRGTWDLPRPGLEPVSPALTGRFITTAPPGKPLFSSFIQL